MSDSQSATKPAIGTTAWLTLAGMICLTFLVYWPSLHGGFLFDDRYYVESPDIHVTTLEPGAWIRAALSQAGTNQFRALSMLSFAANYYFTGLDPFWLKLTNVVIHACNGLLLFFLLRELFGLWKMCNARARAAPRELDLIAVAIAGAWLLLPINLTGVAYVSQRLESLANLFVFLGLLWYLRARRASYAGGPSKALWISLGVCMVLGLSAKESAALLPLYTACAEFAITRFRNSDGKWNKSALWLHITVLVVPLVAGLIWVSGWIFRANAGIRTFTIGERLLTEPRVLTDYIQWTLLPNLNVLTFYHDDIPVSHSLIDPPTTLAAIVFLAALLGVALWQRARRPLLCLGILWFFAGHSMTATIIPLELVFEHRNYFPSLGLLLAVASLLALEPGVKRAGLKIFAASALTVFFAFTTFLRAEEWSNPLRLAYSEALKRPQSPRAQYELARTLILITRDGDNTTLMKDSIKILERTSLLPNSGIAPLQALIYVTARAHRPIDPAWWQAIVSKLEQNPPSQTDIDSIVFLFHCQLGGDCPPQKQELLDAFTTALSKSGGNVYLTAAYADFAFNELGDVVLAERMFRAALAARPQVPVYHSNLIVFLIATKQFDAADSAMLQLAALNRFGSLDSMLEQLRTRLAAARNATNAETPALQPPRAQPDSSAHPRDFHDRTRDANRLPTR